jgi:hypothetical protein
MIDFEGKRAAFLRRVREMTIFPNVPIVEQTRVVDDLAITGDDLYELVEWMRSHFGIDFTNMDISEYSPGEGFEFQVRTYKPLSVGDLIQCIRIGRFELK